MAAEQEAMELVEDTEAVEATHEEGGEAMEEEAGHEAAEGDAEGDAEAGAEATEGAAENGEAAHAEEHQEDAPAAETKAEEAETPAETAPETKITPKVPAKPKESETDAPEDSRPRVAAGSVDINMCDSTINVMPTANNRLLMSLTDCGLSNLTAGVRCNTGLKSGRYAFEVKVMEILGSGHPNPKGPVRATHTLRIGLSAEGSSLILGDMTEEFQFCFDAVEGLFITGNKRKKCPTGPKTRRDATWTMVVNLDAGSENANTVSLFRGGVRVAQPEAIPDKLLGKTLYPHISYKSCSVQVSFGPGPLATLPFACRMLSDASKEDVETSKLVPTSQQGKCEVVFPVGLPETGYFDWVDDFVAKNPSYIELSDRKFVEWAVKSGLPKPKGSESKDKPITKFGIHSMDDPAIRSILKQLATVVQRNWIVPELKANLLEPERKKGLASFAAPHLKTKAVVLVGEPSNDFKAAVQTKLLDEKKAKAIKQKKVEIARKAAEDKKAALSAKKEEKEQDAEMKAADPEEKKEEEEKKEAEEPHIELTDEEKALKCVPSSTPDLFDTVLSRSYASFSLPTKEEGFDEVVYEWQPEATAETALKSWIFNKKLTQRVEDLSPGEAFKESYTAWQEKVRAWRKIHSDWQDPTRKKVLLEKRAEAKKKELEEKEKAEGGEEGEEAAKAEPAKDPEVDVEELDVFTVEDVCDIGNGQPLFADFQFEDWTLLSTRYELHLLLHSFKKDLNDPDRPGFAEKDLGFYYNKYFKKQFSLSSFNLETTAALQELLKDTFAISDKTSFLEASQDEDTAPAQFLKITEDHRRERQRRLDAGDETAELKFPRTQGKSNSWGSGGKGGAKGSGKGASSGKGGKSAGYSSTKGSISSSRPAVGGGKPKGSVSGKSGGGSGGGGGGGGCKGGGKYSSGASRPTLSSAGSSAPNRYRGSTGSGGGYASNPHRATFTGGNAGPGSAQKRGWEPSAPGYNSSKYPRSSYGSGGGGGGNYRRSGY